MARMGRIARRAKGMGMADDSVESAEIEMIEQETLLDDPRDAVAASVPARMAPPRAVTYAAPGDLPDPDQALSDPDLPYWLALNRVKGIGPARFRLLLDTFGTAEAAWGGDVGTWQAAGLDARTAAAFAQQRGRIVPQAELERLEKLRISVLRFTDPGYPRLLPEDDWAVAVVGTRRAIAPPYEIT